MTDCKYCVNDLDAEICGKTISIPNGWGMTCTRSVNHVGDHVACGAHHDIARRTNVVEDKS